MARAPKLVSSTAAPTVAPSDAPSAASTTASVEVLDAPAGPRTSALAAHLHGHARTWQMPWQRMAHTQRLMASFMVSGCDNHLKVGTLLAEASQPETWREALQIQAAIGERLQQQQQAWTRGLDQIMVEYLQLNQANTLSKWVEQEYNIGMQLGTLCFNQLVNLTALAENIQVDLGYWLSLRERGA